MAGTEDLNARVEDLEAVVADLQDRIRGLVKVLGGDYQTRIEARYDVTNLPTVDARLKRLGA